MGYDASPAPMVIPHPSKKLARKLPCGKQPKKKKKHSIHEKGKAGACFHTLNHRH
jgi:hypothetical protein